MEAVPARDAEIRASENQRRLLQLAVAPDVAAVNGLG
jgi:hypothetical protein